MMTSIIWRRMPTSPPSSKISVHYCRMLLCDTTIRDPSTKLCGAIIANGVVKNPSKRCKMFAMTDASNTVQIFVACAMQGIRFSSINCLQ